MLDSDRSGKVFIAYKGTEFNSRQIENKLRSIYPSDFTVKVEFIENSKIVYSNYIRNRVPWVCKG